MSFLNFAALGKKKGQKSQSLKIFLCLFFVLIIFLNFFYNSDSFNYLNDSNDPLNDESENVSEFTQNNPIPAADTSMLQIPFTKNLDLMRQFFIENYQSSLDLNIPTYFRYGDSNGTIIDDTIYSEDNLLLYKTLMKSEIDQKETFEIYLDLKSTPLWYKDGITNFKYGFVRSIDGSTGEIKDSNRYLIDNLLPIFLLIENIGSNIDDNAISIKNTTPKDSIEEMFSLINSSNVFWDNQYLGFFNHNYTNPTSTSKKFTESNLYAILANLLIHRTYKQFDLEDDKNIKDRAYDLANQTMDALVTSMWDPVYDGFYHDAIRNWHTDLSGQKRFHLSVNALGIITLLEYWIETGMKNESTYYNRAVDIYQKLDEKLWDGTQYNLYYNVSDYDWASIYDYDFDLKANAMMMSACLKLFEVTGNFTYYERAINVSKSIENYFFDNINGAYNFSLTDGNKNFNSNLKLCESLLKAAEIYGSTVLISEYNISTEIPNYIFNQDVMNLTSTYSFINNDYYFNQSVNSYVPFTVSYNMTDASINYLLKYPNGTFLDTFNYQISSPATNHTFIYDIEETLPIGDGYSLYIWANKSYFGMAQTLKHFNVFSGLINKTIKGLGSIIYQGPIVNVSLTVNYTRNNNLTLTTYLEGDDIITSPPQEINFTSLEVITIYFNLTAKLGSIPGPSEIFFKITKGNVIYLSVRKVIEIGYSFDYKDLVYESKIVSGDSIYVSLDLINYLPDATQSLNVSFSGITPDIIEPIIKEETLLENEVKTVSFFLKTLENVKNGTFEIKMDIKQNATLYYSENLTITLMPKFEILSVSFPSAISQGASAYIIILIQYNKENPENFSFYINNILVETNIDEFVHGVNRIVKKITPTLNPYEFGIKAYKFELKDSSGRYIAQFYFEVDLELSTFNLIIFYLLPSIIPIGIILYFLNKEIKHKKLTR
ncbi:MAG: hypothetical protein ACFFB0_09930 [Promethearchaeota archaeon]